MQANEDDVFNHEVAKRSVARAALHLGVDSMSEEALDVMGDVLLTYIQRVAKTISQMVESSNRTTAHVNVLDALRAVDMCTSPALHQIHMEGDESVGPSDVGWKDLASFIFGPDWMQRKEEVTQPEAGGKVGPSSVANKAEKGWEAPYLDEIPHYPRASKACANPHRLGRHEALSLHGQMPSPTHEPHPQTLTQLPDEIFELEWEKVLQPASKKKKADMDHKDAPPAKRVKLQDGKEASATDEKEGNKTEDGKVTAATNERKPHVDKAPPRPAYVPSFLPPFPKSGPGRAIAVADEDIVPLKSKTATPTTTTTTTVSSSTADPLNVRSSLVKMEQNYWGSGWDAEPTKVPAGRRPPSETEKEKVEKQKVAPLERPSLSRTSRILEGSMDATI